MKQGVVQDTSAGRDPTCRPKGELMSVYNACRQTDLAGWLAECPELAPPRKTHILLAFPSQWTPRLPGHMTQIREPRRMKHAQEKGMGDADAVAICPYGAFFLEADELVRFVSEAVQEGVRRFVFEGLDDLPDEAVTWVKQAVRFARRD